jgi:hypothetical protein
MIERRGDAGFATETVERFGMRGELARQELQRDVPAEAHIFGAIDDAHAAAAQPVDDPIVPDGCSDHDWLWIVAQPFRAAGARSKQA